MSMDDFYKTFFDFFPAELQKRYKSIIVEFCVDDVRHIYYFKNKKLYSVKFDVPSSLINNSKAYSK